MSAARVREDRELSFEDDAGLSGHFGADRGERSPAAQRDLLEDDAVRQIGALEAVDDRSALNGDLVGDLLGEPVARGALRTGIGSVSSTTSPALHSRSMRAYEPGAAASMRSPLTVSAASDAQPGMRRCRGIPPCSAVVTVKVIVSAHG